MFGSYDTSQFKLEYDVRYLQAFEEDFFSVLFY